MGLTTRSACFALCGVWLLISSADSILAPNLTLSEMAEMFQQFMKRFDKKYQDQKEMDYRFKVFVQSLERSRELQASETGTAQYGVTRFSDLTESEFAEKFCMAPRSLPRLPPTLGWLEKPPRMNVNQSCDWRKAGAVTEVKHQGESCRACWAFAAVSNIEALWNIHRHSPRNLSVQEMVDCTNDMGGCKGGYPWEGFQLVFNQNGLVNSVMYPYEGKVHRCRKHRGRKLTQIDGYEVLPRDEEYIAGIVASKGPVTALIDSRVLRDYQSGTIRRPPLNCERLLDHVVLIVGFDEGECPFSKGSGSFQGELLRLPETTGPQVHGRGF
ncbi:cathepsin W-like [Varanus komodoensis]|uniref:cathepsin W-like n=1 Tax=Varanus komodoensis TaxID=61221 RepID=UPI001CF77DA0|nr:cathepsin W-like [Varanus komodoensis]